VKSALMSRGWAEVPEGEGRAAVVLHAATQAKHTDDTLYEGWGGWGWRRGWDGRDDRAMALVGNYKVGTLVVDIFDANSKQAIWHGYASHALLNGHRSNARATEAAVQKMFYTFPPPSGVAKGR
jgi:hypothetical protein